MSVEALAWLGQRAPGVKPHWIGTLFGLANHADEDGKGSRPSQALLAWYARKDERAVREDLRGLEGAGLIRKGDQRMVLHLPPDKRPVVWDLALELDRGPRPQPGRPGRPRKREVPGTPPVSSAAGGSSDPGGCVDPPVSDLGKQENGGISSVKRGGPEIRQTFLEPKPPLPKEGEREPTPPPQPQPPTELTADELTLAAEVAAAAPRWSPASVRAVLAEPAIRERADRKLVRLAFLMAAEDRRTRTPRRLLHDACPAWARAENQLYPEPPAAAAGPLVGVRDWCGAPSCDPVTRTAVDPDTGAPVPGWARCPVCHPQSPRPAAVPPPQVFVCPDCHARSAHPEDLRNGYCARCHDFTGDPAEITPERYPSSV